MSYITDRYTLNKLPGQSLAVVECGIQICHPGHTTPPLCYRDYSAHFILEGKGIYELEGKKYHLGPGEGFLITPGTDCTYAADHREPWRYIYASFRGIDDIALVHNAGLSEAAVTFSFDLAETEPLLYAMHAAGKKNEARGYDVTGWFLLIMSRLVAKNLEQPPSGERYIRRVKQYVEDNFPFPITVNSMAAHVGLERSYLYKLFLQQEGVPPSRYLQQYRLTRAAELLRDGRLSVAEVAEAVGFSDLSYFYRAFRKHYGVTPKQFCEFAE
ncbi:MAG: AraC family transcriptional regulator [Clostridia bacterium]|nr:AraC family transcriptional regulator [Clostridia bacterium]